MKSWDALPARKKRNRQTTQVEDSATAQEEIVVRVLEERSHVVRAKATLEGQDGCAGEFYECANNFLDNCFVTFFSLHMLVFRFRSYRRCSVSCLGCHPQGGLRQHSTLHVQLHHRFVHSNWRWGTRCYIYCHRFTLFLSWPELCKGFLMIISGHDLQSLLFAYMDEMLFRFCTDGFCFKRVEIIDFNLTSFSITLIGYVHCTFFTVITSTFSYVVNKWIRLCRISHGEMYSQSKHPQGTEIKAITYSNMQIHSGDTRSEIYVIVDI